MTPGQRAERVIAELGITSPGELDVDAIAFDAGVSVRYAELTGCEATLVGVGDLAIATVKRSKYRGRERFSTAHELGHWKLHRGQSFQCRVDSPENNFTSDRVKEREADTFASHLLMPAPLFNPVIKELGRPGFKQLEDVSQTFTTTLTATALRVAAIDTLPVLVAYYAPKGLKWHLRAEHVPRRWWLKDQVDEDTFTFDLLNKGKACSHLGKQSAEAWFQNDDAERYEVLEQCTLIRDGEALVLLYLADADMMDAGYDPNVGNRRYNEHGSYLAKRNVR